jgi:KUP system potassium uptake protein
MVTLAKRAPMATAAPRVAASIGALGVVFGDIGTSPLYAFAPAFTQVADVPSNAENVFGVLSIIFWTLGLLISVKYVGIVLRSDNRGEGGVLALTLLVLAESPRRYPKLLAGLGLMGCALFYGDGALTPALSVLSAVEGIKVVLPSFEPLVVPMAALILIALFALQRRGTPVIGRLFGPVMLAWFAVLAVLGVRAIAVHPEVLAALSPLYAARFIVAHHLALLAILGAVFLAVTGGEALYADLGHFGRLPISRAWYGIVWPSLLLNYFGQGALLLSDPQAVANPFYLLAPGWAQVPLIILAMAATVIASQGVISGVFSVTEQCQRLGCLPRLEVLHSSSDSIGQVYVPAINRLLCVTTLALVFAFGSSAALGNAYGIAVASTMLIVSVLELVLMHGRKTRTSRLQFIALVGLCAVDGIFWIGNSSKIAQGGWFPFIFGLIIFFLMQTWYSGRSAVSKAAASTEEDLETFLKRVRSNEIVRVPGTAIFMSGNISGVPRSLVLSVKYNRVLHANTILATVVTAQIPRVFDSTRVTVKALAPGLVRLIIRIGFMEGLDMPRMLAEARRCGIEYDPASAIYVMSRDDLMVSPRLKGMAVWRRWIFILMTKVSTPARAEFDIPPDRLIEIGTNLQI